MTPEIDSPAESSSPTEISASAAVKAPVESTFRPFTIKAAWQLCSPPSWVAAISPVLVGGAAAWALADLVPVVWDWRAVICWILMLGCAILAQSTVNVLNDYQDFKSGLDTAENVLDPTDASLVYNGFDPRLALRFGLVLGGLALVLGIVVALLSVWWLLVLGALAVGAVVFYSMGPKPLSALPLGELVSGLAMGGLITVATYLALTRTFTPWLLVVTVPPILTIALIMLSNNTCDITRDIPAGRRTLAIVLGSTGAQRLAGVLALFTLGWMAVWSFIFWLAALLPVAIAALWGYQRLALILRGPYNLENRRNIMQNITAWCLLVNGCWAVGLLTAGLLGAWF